MRRVAYSFLLLLPIACYLVFADVSDEAVEDLKLHDDHPHDSNLTVSRTKRQYRCPANCFSSCSNNYQCQAMPAPSICVQGCCCPSNNVNLESDEWCALAACSGGPAVAACLGGLCGQGFFCTVNNFCCRCQSGNSTGICPLQYICLARVCSDLQVLASTNNARLATFAIQITTAVLLAQEEFSLVNENLWVRIAGPCVNGQCPSGYTCGAGNLCYLTSGK
ncbi:hypothetical protein ANCCEY_11068 [Ancylostoma ceylanicum]|uniref:CC domain-containing protein n=1 Tax=Ancylostoma ceylanicum TaxID=53326 RepID=A0A0D6LIV5_9BILA|nr:hypothetical protein ANCCEY_11068 [Ancylostoma ceylanicum]